MGNILKLVADALEVEEDRITHDTTAGDIEEWDLARATVYSEYTRGKHKW